MKRKTISPNLIVADIMNTWPQSVPVFLKYRMGCIGCSMSSFETLSDAVKIYGLSLHQFLEELEQVVQAPTMDGRRSEF